MRQSIRAVCCVFILAVGILPGDALAQSASVRNPAFAAYSLGDLQTLVMLVMMEEARRSQSDLRDIMKELAARSRDRARLIEAKGTAYFVEEALADYSRQIGGSETARELFAALLVQVLEPGRESEKKLKVALGAAENSDLKKMGKLIEGWAGRIHDDARDIAEAQDRLAKLASNTSSAIRQAHAMAGALHQSYGEDDIMNLLILALMEEKRNRDEDVQNLMKQLSALNRERAKQAEAKGAAYFVNAAIHRYARVIGGNDTVREIAEAILFAIMDPAGGADARLEVAVSRASASDLEDARSIVEDWVARVHASLVAMEDGKAKASKFVSTARRVIRKAEGPDRGYAEVPAGTGAGSLASDGGGTAAAPGGGGSGGGGVGFSGFTDYNVGGGSAGYDTVYGP